MTSDAISKITTLRIEAEELITALGEEEIPDDDPLRAARDEVRELADKLHQAAKDPITLGIVGEFSSGKSMLVSTLLGRPGLLPSQKRPTTGNVTALHLLPGQPGQPTDFEADPVISYMSRLELADCVQYMLDQFAARYTDTFPGADVSLLSDCDPVTKGWQELETWCRANLWGGEVGGRALRQHVAELMAIRDAQLCADKLLGQSVSVADALIRQALDLGDDQPVPDEFPQRRLRPTVALGDLSAGGDALRATFPLIRRVTYRVWVNPAVWSLDALRDENEVVLLDFPGLTAGRSALRDEFLSRDELSDIHTIIVVIDAHKPAGEVQYRFYAMMERKDRTGVGRNLADLREAILVVGNRFDMIDTPPVPTADGPLGIGDLRSLSQQLDGLCVKATDLVEHQDDKIRLASSIAAMHVTGDLGGYATQEGEEGLAVRAAVAGADTGLAAWSELAKRMAATDSADPWSLAVADYAADGGMDGVRLMLEQHARAHGISNKLRSMERIRERMWTALRPLGRSLRGRQPPLSAEEEMQVRIGELFEDFRSRHRQVAAALGDLADPMELNRTDGRPLVETAIEDAVTKVMRWQALQLILRRSDKGYIPRSKVITESGSFDPDVGTGIFGDGGLGNETTATFLSAYRNELKTAVKATRLELAASVREWIDQQNDHLGDLAVRFDDAETRSLLEQGLATIAADYGGADLMAVLDRLKNLSWLASPVTGMLSAELPVGDIDDGYPLYVDRALPWHPDVPELNDDKEQQLARHQFYVLRLQRQIANGLADALSQRLADDLDNLRTQIGFALERRRQRIPGAADVQAMFPPPPEESGGAGAPRGRSPVLDFIARWETRNGA